MWVRSGRKGREDIPIALVYNSIASSNRLALNAVLPSSLTLSALAAFWASVSGGGGGGLVAGTFFGGSGAGLGESTFIGSCFLLTHLQWV